VPPRYGAAAGGYVDAFMGNIDWAKVYARYQAAVHHGERALRRRAGDIPGSVLLDVRRAGVFQYARRCFEADGAIRRRSRSGAPSVAIAR
jgi:hypothetical protein